MLKMFSIQTLLTKFRFKFFHLKFLFIPILCIFVQNFTCLNERSADSEDQLLIALLTNSSQNLSSENCRQSIPNPLNLSQLTGDQFGKDSRCKTPEFKDNGNGTITDNANNLMWTKCNMSQSGFPLGSSTCSLPSPADRKSQADAKNSCESLYFGGYSDWILPDGAMLKSLSDSKSLLTPYINSLFSPNPSTLPYYISSSVDQSLTNEIAINYFSRDVAIIRGQTSSTSIWYFRCVRDLRN